MSSYYASEDVSAEEGHNPLAGYRQRFMPGWPGPAQREESDELFPRGWRPVALEGDRGEALEPSTRHDETLSPAERDAADLSSGAGAGGDPRPRRSP
jgi:hypothetical protein